MKPLILVSVKTKCPPLLTLDSNAGSRKSIPRQHDWQLHRYIPTRRCQGSVEGEYSLCPFPISLQRILLIWSRKIMNCHLTLFKILCNPEHMVRNFLTTCERTKAYQFLDFCLMFGVVCVREVMTLFEIVTLICSNSQWSEFFNTYFCQFCTNAALHVCDSLWLPKTTFFNLIKSKNWSKFM